MKKIRFLFFVCCLFAMVCLIQKNTAFANENPLNRPIDTKDTFNETFFTYNEFLELYEFNGSRSHYLKEKFKPYESKILKEKFYDKLYKIDNEYFTYENWNWGTFNLPVYTAGKLYYGFDKGTVNSRRLSGWRSAIWRDLGNAIEQEENIKTTVIKGGIELDYVGNEYFVFLFCAENEFNPKTDIGIAVKTISFSKVSSPEGYTYPTEDELYEYYSGSKGKVTPTPIPTATPKPTTTPTPEPTATPTPEPTAAPTPEPTATPTPEPTATPTPEPTATPTPEPTATPVPTSTPTPEPTATPVPTSTSTPTPKLTQTPVQPDTPSSNLGIIVSFSSIVALIVVILVVIFFRNKKK